jgi:hypothetical protein
MTASSITVFIDSLNPSCVYRSSLGNSYGQPAYGQPVDLAAQTQRLSLGDGPRTIRGQPLPSKKEPEKRADDIDALFADLVNLKKPQFGGKS